MSSNSRHPRAEGASERPTSVPRVAMRDTVRSKARTVASLIRAYVEDGIANGVLQPGMKLPTERDFTASFSAGRNTVRKVMQALEAEGKIVRQVGSGTFVAADRGARQGSGGPATDWVARLATPSDLMELRLAVEPALMPLVALHASLEEIEQMERIVESGTRAKSLQQFERLDCDLHNCLGRATKNVLVVKVYDMITTVRERAAWGRLKERMLTAEQRRRHTQEHARIVAAIRERDGGRASNEMRHHLQEINRCLFGTHAQDSTPTSGPNA
jgi:DNA-binding FadR family transcriptional regulator